MSTLIEKLDALVECGNDDYFNDGVYASMEVVGQHSDWISVDERLPDDKSLRYELFTPSDDMTLRHRFCHCDDVKKSTDATHWRVAQQPPSEVQP